MRTNLLLALGILALLAMRLADGGAVVAMPPPPISTAIVVTATPSPTVAPPTPRAYGAHRVLLPVVHNK